MDTQEKYEQLTFLLNKWLKKVYIMNLLEGKNIDDFITEKQEISSNEKYKENLSKIKALNLFNLDDTLEVLEKLKLKIQEINREKKFRLGEIISDTEIQKNHLDLAFLLVNKDPKVLKEYEEFKKEKETTKLKKDYEILIANTSFLRENLTDELEKLFNSCHEYSNISKKGLIKNIGRKKKIKAKIKEMLSLIERIIIENRNSYENKELKEVELYENTNIEEQLELIINMCEENKTGILTKDMIIELDHNLKLKINEMKQKQEEIIITPITDKTYHYELKEYLNNSRNNYIFYILNFINNLEENDIKRKRYIDILEIILLINNIENNNYDLIEIYKMVSKDYEIKLFNTIVNDEDMEKNIEVQNKILNELENTLEDTRKNVK